MFRDAPINKPIRRMYGRRLLLQGVMFSRRPVVALYRPNTLLVPFWLSLWVKMENRARRGGEDSSIQRFSH